MLKYIQFVTFLLTISFYSVAQNIEQDAKIFSIEGFAEVQKSDSKSWSKASVGQVIKPADIIRTLQDSRVAIIMDDGVMVRLNQNSSFHYKSENKNRGLNLSQGEAYFLSRQEKEFPVITTPLVTASVRGTEFTVRTDPESSKISVLQGLVDCQNKFGSTSLSQGEQAIVDKGQAPRKMLIADSDKTVQWALNYPVITNQNDSDQIKKAAFYLSRGQVAAAESIHQQLLEKNNNQSNSVLAQQLIIAIVNNKLDQANQIGSLLKNQTLSSSSALSLSYLAQANLDLNSAQHYINEALKNDSANSELRARNAELLLALGDSKASFDEASQSVELDATNAYGLTVLGFVQLSRNQISSAIQSFDQAVLSSSPYGLSYLGLGLAKIRKGQIEQGRVLIQQAVNMEPSYSLFRSYLGKAFFENDQHIFALSEFDRAISLDSKDPTPYFYRAFSKLALNRPVSALDDLEKSISLNDNRAVYRSRLLLDEDKSVRTSSLSQIYKTVGFTELSRVEAIKSLNDDYSNFSAHLLLSEAYEPFDSLLLSNISEFLVAKLLSPVNYNLIRPNQSGSVGSNEFTALFDRDISRSEIGVDANTKNRSGLVRLVTAGTTDGLGYAFEYNPTYSDGFRDNDRNVEHLIYASLQQQLSPDSVLLLDANADIVSAGDTSINYNPKANDPDSSQEVDDYLIRLGFSHKFSQKEQIINQLVLNDSSFDATDLSSSRSILQSVLTDGEITDTSLLFLDAIQNLKYKSKGIRFDTQYIRDSENYSTVLGAAALNSDLKQRDLATDVANSNSILFSSSADNTEISHRIYDYTTLNIARWLDIHTGLSYSSLRLSSSPLSYPFIESVESKYHLSPKIGLTLHPTSTTMLRAAFFESIGTSGIREIEQIEPTLFAGFNQQFFDFFPGTFSRNLAVGVDQKLQTKTYFGLEGIHRNIIRNTPQTIDSIVIDSDTQNIIASGVDLFADDNYNDEDIIKSYLYQVLSDEFTATADYAWILNRDMSFDTYSKTNRVKLALNYFDPTGMFGFVNGTYRTQQLDGYDPSADSIANGNHSFWLVDAGVGYRFAKRQGQVTFALNNILDKNFKYAPTSVDSLLFPGLGATLSFAYNF